MRMKTLANLAADGPKKRRRGGDDDTFGANDDDWGVYRTVQADPDDEDDEEEDLGAGLKSIEAQLLQYDTSFTEIYTFDAQSDWTKSMKHAFLHGPRPYDNEAPQEVHQVHLNVERIRIPEVVFQPSIAGADQAGIVEIMADIVLQRISDESERTRLLRDVFLTGGNSLFTNIDQRLAAELRGVIPIDTKLAVRKAQDPVLDAWRGASQWWTGASGSSSELAKATVSRGEYLEKGSEYIKVGHPFSINHRLLLDDYNFLLKKVIHLCSLLRLSPLCDPCLYPNRVTGTPAWQCNYFAVHNMMPPSCP